jgi:hypothetical protein
MPPIARQDWELHERLCRKDHVEWLRSLTPAQSLALYEDFHRFAASVKIPPEEAARLESSHWQEKLSLRKKLLAAFARLDEVERGRRHPTNAE